MHLMGLVADASVFADVAVFAVDVVAAVASAAVVAALSAAVLDAAAAAATVDALLFASLMVWNALENGFQSNGFCLSESPCLGIGQLSLPSSVGPRLGSCSSSCLMGSLLLAWGPF